MVDIMRRITRNLDGGDDDTKHLLVDSTSMMFNPCSDELKLMSNS